LAIHLHQFGFSPTYIGLAFAVPGIVYAGMAPMIHKLTAIAPKRAVIIFGCLLTSIGMFCVGTSKSLGLENNPELILAGMTVLGGAAAVMSIPVLPEMMEAVEKYSTMKYNTDELDNYIAAVFTISNGVGEAIGPVLSSHLNEAYGFREAQDYYAFGVLSFAIVYFILAGHFKLIFKIRSKSSEASEGKHSKMVDEITVTEQSVAERGLAAVKS